MNVGNMEVMRKAKGKKSIRKMGRENNAEG